MATKIEMPKLSNSMLKGMLCSWKKKEGDFVKSGEILAEIEFDKANMEFENSVEGTLLKILVSEGEHVPVGKAIAIIGEEGEEIDSLLKEEVISLKKEITPPLLSPIRQTIAKRMIESKATIPHFYIKVSIDMQAAHELRLKLKKEETGSVSFNDMLIRACALSLKSYPGMNASFEGDSIKVFNEVHIGVAVGVPDAVIVPVIRNADKKSLFDISAEMKLLAIRAKEKKLKPEEYSGSTFSISNMGSFDIVDFAAIINPPEAAILAVSSVLDTPVVKKGEIVVGKKMNVTLSGDHRVSDGVLAARFLKEIRKHLEKPELLMEN